MVVTLPLCGGKAPYRMERIEARMERMKAV